MNMMGCATQQTPPPDAVQLEQCNIQAYLNLPIKDYLSARYRYVQPVRAAIIPFDVPETFAPSGQDRLHSGRKLAELFQREFHKNQVFHITELFNRDRWPGKREEFFTGNYKAIEIARRAGYDFVIVGYLDYLTDDQSISVNTKIIDTSSNVTTWYGRTTVTSYRRPIRDFFWWLGLADSRPDIFAFEQRFEEFSICTVKYLLTSPPVP